MSNEVPKSIARWCVAIDQSCALRGETAESRIVDAIVMRDGSYEKEKADLRRLVEEAQAETKRAQVEAADATLDAHRLYAERDRLKGELATERESHRRTSSDAHHWEEVAANLREENTSLKSELAEARRLLVVAENAVPTDSAIEDQIGVFLNAVAPPAEQAQGEGAPAVWPTIHGLEQHYREVRGQVAELGKRVEAFEIDVGNKTWAEIDRRVKVLERKLADVEDYDPDFVPAPPPPEAAGPGHAWRCAAGGSSCVVDGCRCADCDVPKNVHAGPPITGSGK